MKTELTLHAQERARQRAVSEKLCDSLFRKALRGVRNGVGFEIIQDDGTRKLTWKGWRFIYVIDESKARPTFTLITTYKTPEFSFIGS